MAIPGVVAVTRASAEHATGPVAPRGELPYLLYYRGEQDAAALSKLEPEADVISRDLDAVEHWVSEAGEGRFEIDAVDDWLAGRPTYALVGELAACEMLSGELPRPEFPAALREPAARRWREVAARALEVAESLAARGDVAGCGGQLAKAAIAAAQARLAERGEWVLGESRIVRRAPRAARSAGSCRACPRHPEARPTRARSEQSQRPVRRRPRPRGRRMDGGAVRPPPATPDSPTPAGPRRRPVRTEQAEPGAGRAPPTARPYATGPATASAAQAPHRAGALSLP
jgi:hypothetical protein